MRRVALLGVFLAFAFHASPVNARCCVHGGYFQCCGGGCCIGQNRQETDERVTACEAKCPAQGDDDEAFKAQAACMNKQCPVGK